jgi:hypothetical protein
MQHTIILEHTFRYKIHKNTKIQVHKEGNFRISGFFQVFNKFFNFRANTKLKAIIQRAEHWTQYQSNETMTPYFLNIRFSPVRLNSRWNRLFAKSSKEGHIKQCHLQQP